MGVCITVCSVMCGMLVDSTSLIKFVLSSECTAACAVLRPARPMRPSRPALKLVLQLVLCLAARPHGQPLADHVPMAQSCNKLPTASTSALLGWLGAKLVHSSPCLSASVAHGARGNLPLAEFLFFFSTPSVLI